MRRILSAALAVTAALLPLSPAQAAPAGDGVAGPIDVVGLDFQVVNVGSGGCLATAGDALVQRPCADAAAYRWRFRPASFAGTFQILNVARDRCLSTTVGAAGVAECDADPARHWRLLDSTGETANVQSVATRRCLAGTPGGAVVETGCDARAARRWTVRVLSVPFLG